MKIVKTKSIPNVDDERLLDSLAQVHAMCHTLEGLRAHEDTRRSLIDHGIKGLKIRDELKRRGVTIEIDCPRWCSA